MSVVCVLEEYKTMLLGAEIEVYTDHKNLTFQNLNSQRIVRWRNSLEEFGPTFYYIPGPKNVLADAFSRLPKMEPPSKVPKELKRPISPTSAMDERVSPGGPLSVAFFFLHCDLGSNAEGKNTATPFEINNEQYLSITEDSELLDCFLNLPEITPGANETMPSPLNFEWLQSKQNQDATIQDWVQRHPQTFQTRAFTESVDLVTHVRQGDDPNMDWKIVIPENIINQVIKWFHQVLGHPGNNRMRDAIQARYWHPNLRSYIDKFACGICQKHKLSGRQFGLLPERDVRTHPWQEVAVDLIGPWAVNIRDQWYEFNALTSIDMVTNLVEIIRVDRKTSAHIRTKFEQSWLARYPWPKRCIHDNGGEFNGHEFQELQTLCQIKDVPTTSRNPQANAVCERMHQTVGNVLRTLLYSNPPRTITNAADLVDQALSTAMHAMRTNIHTTLKGSPGSLVFGRDMFLDVPLIADWQAIQLHRRTIVNERLRKANLGRRTYDYIQGQKVLKKLTKPDKLGLRKEGPYLITQVHTNGNVTMQLRPGVTERINIRRIEPYKEPT